jgi:hypothetical protein
MQFLMTVLLVSLFFMMSLLLSQFAKLFIEHGVVLRVFRFSWWLLGHLYSFIFGWLSLSQLD